MFCIENFNTPLSDREQKSALETWIKLIQPGEPMKSVGCEWTDDGKYQPRGKERGCYEAQGEEYLFIKAPAVSCGESERKREKNSVNRSNCDH